MNPVEHALSAGGIGHCCDETAGMVEIHRFFRRLTCARVEDLCEERDLCETDIVSVPTQASIRCCSKDGMGTRHIEALFSTMRMLGLRLVSPSCVVLPLIFQVITHRSKIGETTQAG